MGHKHIVEKLVFISMLVALSIVLGYFDKMIQILTVTPAGYKLGLANIVILTGLYYLKFKDALLLVILKSVIGGLYAGSFMAFIIGLSGTLLSFFVMYLLLKIARKYLSLIGISVTGSIFHNIGQILVVTLIYGKGIIAYLIYLIPLGIGTGIFVGFMVTTLTTYLNKGEVFKTVTKNYRTDELEELNEV
ncbi:Gx transporter family protein [Haloplasma contractile]|uniref:Heptaprenyl diphosphate synthase protein n=1 Tax=Haloplasma contractile SSD-17B TaxID=1033810 RepID=U2FMW5_9MOLU|nr:Gx transporter family protein [Haloplasma contractile]ERJ12484.1 heptaprenyl diphosphate synthase protein [Haloplasma contractile SSD-17B]